MGPMLLELRIENLLLIERAELRLGPGLNAITGETGAGKTVLAHSLDLLMGGRARPQVVRPGAAEAYVEGTFELPDGLFEDQELAPLGERLPHDASELVLARRVLSGGRTSAYVQGRSANVADLRALGSRLLAFYGQHEHRRLTLTAAQIDVVDGFAGEAHLELRRSYRGAHERVRALERELTELREREGVRERDLDLMRFELAEIEAAQPDPVEREDLDGRRSRLRHSERLRAAAAGAHAYVAGSGEDDGAVSLIAQAESALRGAAGLDPRLDALAERAATASLELADFAGELRDYAEASADEPDALEQVEERLAAIERLERKHGGTLEAVLAHAESCRGEIARLENADELAADRQRRLAEASEERARLAQELSAGREKAAPRLEHAVAEALSRLAMDGARLTVALQPLEGGYGSNGAETVELRVATNPGMPVAPLRDAASGGELSRIMLALSGLAGAGAEMTRVFDEIDAGVGGATARSVGERLRELGDAGQVLCITHLPQVAALAHTHFRITKGVEAGATFAIVDRIEGDELVAEIARMLGGDRDAAAATTHARELLAA